MASVSGRACLMLRRCGRCDMAKAAIAAITSMTTTVRADKVNASPLRKNGNMVLRIFKSRVMLLYLFQSQLHDLLNRQ